MVWVSDSTQKISTYLLAYSLQDANTRFIGVFYKVLNVNKLYLKDTFQFCNKHYFSMRLSPYQRLKCTKPCPKTDVIGLWYGYYQNVKWIISGYNDGYIKIRYYMKFPLLYWIRQSITSIFRFYFVKIKSRKIVSEVSPFSLKTLMSYVRMG